MRGRRRGNVILTALFISMFLFFLSVALVSANRQDIMLELSTDHRLRAEMAARAGVNFALQTMRTDPDWAQVLDTYQHDGNAYEMASGAKWTVVVSPYADPGGTAIFHEVDAKGTSGFLSAHHRIVVEEVRFGSDLATADVPLLFAVDPNVDPPDLWMLDPEEFEWKLFGDVVRGAWLAAREGPLFSYAGEGSAAGPPFYDQVREDQGNAAEFDDWENPQVGFAGAIWPNVVGVDLGSSAQDEHAIWLNFTSADQGQVASWVDIPDPSLLEDPLTRYAEATIDGTPITENPPIRTQTVLFQGQPVEIPISRFRGRVVEWYSLTGTALAADGNRIYCHARHNLYQGPEFWNEIPGDPSQPLVIPHIVRPTLRPDPPVAAVLVHDLTTGRWERVVDPMELADLQGAPTLPPPEMPRPDTNSLAILTGTAYAYDNSDRQQILIGQASGWADDRTSTGQSFALVPYDDQLWVHEPVGAQLPDGFQRFVLQTRLGGELDPNPLGFRREDIVGHRYQKVDGTFEPVIVQPEVEVRLNLLGRLATSDDDTSEGFDGMPTRGGNCVAVLGDHLFTFARVRRDIRRDPTSEIPYAEEFDDGFFQKNSLNQELALVRWNGQSWDLYPGGVREMAARRGGWQEDGTIPIKGDKDEDGVAEQHPLSPEHLAVALYKGQTRHQSRFVPVVTRR